MIDELAIQQVKPVAAEASSLRDQYAVGSRLRNFNLRANLERFILCVRRTAFGNADVAGVCLPGDSNGVVGEVDVEDVIGVTQVCLTRRREKKSPRQTRRRRRHLSSVL
jgi:hypothetical protein